MSTCPRRRTGSGGSSRTHRSRAPPNEETSMKPFDYHRPDGAAAAVSLAGGEVRFLAGGMTLLPTMKQKLATPSALVDLAGVAELIGIRETGGVLEIGAMTTHAAVAA